MCGPLAVHRTGVFWVASLQVGMLASRTPVGIALGDPAGLLRARLQALPSWATPPVHTFLAFIDGLLDAIRHRRDDELAAPGLWWEQDPPLASRFRPPD